MGYKNINVDFENKYGGIVYIFEGKPRHKCSICGKLVNLGINIFTRKQKWFCEECWKVFLDRINELRELKEVLVEKEI